MTETDNEKNDDVNSLAERIGLQYPIRISIELSELLKPNDFLAGLGIQFSDRINTVLSILKGNLTPDNSGGKRALPKSGIVIPIPLAKGPYIREEMISVKAELTDDGEQAGILLTAVLE